MTIQSRDTPAATTRYTSTRAYSYTLTIDEPTEASRDGEITHLAELGYDE